MDNLGFLTDFKLLGKDSEIIEYQDYFLIKTPSNPTFIDGNCMVLKSLDPLQNKQALEMCFKANFGVTTNQHHINFKLMTKPTESLLNGYLQDEYSYDQLAVMGYEKATSMMPALENKGWIIRAFVTDLDWNQWAENEIRERPTIFTANSFKEYLFGRRVVYQQMTKEGCGNFYGVFMGSELVASAGLYIFDRIGRFQQVRTIEKARRKGLCKALIQHIYTNNATKMKATIMVADEDYHALKIYEGLGFKSKQNQYDLTKVFPH